MHTIELFQDAVQRGDYATALPLIEQVVQQHPNIGTNWYNYGDCLEKMGRHNRAATAFMTAVRCDPTDGGAYYRACLALVEAKNTEGLLAVFRQICQVRASMLETLKAEPEFAPYFQIPEFADLERQIGQH